MVIFFIVGHVQSKDIENDEITTNYMEEKYIKFYLMFDKRFKNLILCTKILSDGRIN